jgi:hypothetical protein
MFGEFLDAVDRAVELIERGDGAVLVFEAVPHGDATRARLVARFNEEREAEWAEFLTECTKFEREIDKEVRVEKFTTAELDEEEQNLERLRRWFRELRGRDLFTAGSQPEAEQRLKVCTERLEDYAERVFEHGGSPA